MPCATACLPISQGAFGDVCKGMLMQEDRSEVECACKTLKPNATEADKEALLAEAQLVSSFDHANVVKCYGQLSIGEPRMIVFEFMANGSLYGWLEKKGAVGRVGSNGCAFAQSSRPPPR